MKVITKAVSAPTLSDNMIPVDLTDETIKARIAKLITAMQNHHLDTVIIYADREHGANFEYFTGFVPRFEEACLIIHIDGKAYLMLGNENTKMGNYSRINAQVIHVPYFSLPNQPMEDDAPFTHYLTLAGIQPKNQIGIIGWKYFTTKFQDHRTLFDVPYFIVSALAEIVTNKSQLKNYADILIAPESGIRTVNNANEIAHYEYGATLAGMCVLNTLNSIELGKTELELANNLSINGQPHNVTTICATGARFTNATLYPRNKKVTLSDTFSITTGYKGGLSSRAAYIAKSADDLPTESQDYEQKLAHPYYKAVATWLSSIRIGMSGAELYQKIEHVLPKSQYHWELNPGHFTADEEWLSSPIDKNSSCLLKSGQLFQIDIIPRIKGYGGVGCEDGIALADLALRKEIEHHYPELWRRFVKRRQYIIEVLNIPLSEDVLPMNDIVAYYRPYLLNKQMVFAIE